jgi:hypothetical protein
MPRKTPTKEQLRRTPSEETTLHDIYVCAILPALIAHADTNLDSPTAIIQGARLMADECLKQRSDLEEE